MNADPVLPTTEGFLHQMRSLWQRQTEQWPMLAAGQDALRSARTRTFHVGVSAISAQCNPARTASASADVSPQALADRPCFLCPGNLPPEQKGLVYRDRWLVLCNPAPLFEPHYTITSLEHRAQRLADALPTMLDLVRDLDGAYTIFYNGPLCGASAPDHLHLQACAAGATPFETELASQLCTNSQGDAHRWIRWLSDHGTRIAVSRPSHRPVLVLMGGGLPELLDSFEGVHRQLERIHPAEPEPMLNLFVTYTDGQWIAWLFPRAVHRPRLYGRGPDDYLISPGAIDLAGIVIVPRPYDFDRLTDGTIQAIYDEVLLSPSRMAELADAITSDLTPRGA